jgi:hypothetical protein
VIFNSTEILFQCFECGLKEMESLILSDFFYFSSTSTFRGFVHNSYLETFNLISEIHIKIPLGKKWRKIWFIPFSFFNQFFFLQTVK